jgi:hypothetical protein
MIYLEPVMKDCWFLALELGGRRFQLSDLAMHVEIIYLLFIADLAFLRKTAMLMCMRCSWGAVMHI